VKPPNTIWIAGICVLLMAGPAYPQSKVEAAVYQLQRDMLTVQNQMKELQTSIEQNNRNLLTLVNKLTAQLDTLNATIPKIADAVGANVRSDNQKTATEIKTLVSGLKDSLNELNLGLNGRDGVRAQLISLVQQIKEMRTANPEALATPEDLMRTAYADCSGRNWNLCLAEFKEFLAKYPNHPRAGEAQFEIGEIYANQKPSKWEEAITQYDIVLQKYPKDDFSITALYKEGLAYTETGQNDKAIAPLNRLMMEFSSSSEAVLAKQILTEWAPPPPPSEGRGRNQACVD